MNDPTFRTRTPIIRQRNRPAATSLRMPDPAPVENSIDRSRYEVGYGKPPVTQRFRPGQSGNPKGRPKGARGLKTMVREILSKPIVVRTDGKSRKVAHVEALLLKSVELAIKGDPRSMDRCLQLYNAAVPDQAEVATASTSHEDGPDDQAILEAFLQRKLAARVVEGGDA